MSSVKLNLREMLDIALPAPGMEVINFHILHKLLNAMIEALQMDQMQVDLSSSSLIPSKDESTETVQTLDGDIDGGNEMTQRDDDGKGKNNNYYYNRTPNQSDRKCIEAAETMAVKIGEMDTQIMCLNDYVIQCMRVISSTIGLKNLPQPSVTEAEMAADHFLCEIIQTVEAVPVKAPVFDRLTEIENDQLKQWNDLAALNTALDKYAKDTGELMEDVKLLKCKSKQMLDDYTRFVAKTEFSFESQNKANESMEKRVKVVSTMLEREKKLNNCSIKGMEGMLDQKVDRYDLEMVKEYVKSKVKELKVRPTPGGTKNNDEISSETEMKNRKNSENTTSKPTLMDKINQEWQTHANTLAMFNEADMSSCACSYVKGANGSVYRTNCVCCKQKSKNIPNT